MTVTTLPPTLHIPDVIVPADAPWIPVFVDPTGRRHRLVQIAMSVLALAAATPMVIAGAAMLPL